MNALQSHQLSLAVFGLGALAMYGCAVQQPMANGGYAPIRQERRIASKPASLFASKVTAEVAVTPPEQPVTPQASPNPSLSPRSQPSRAQARGPLTNAEEDEIDTQVMP